MLTSAHISTLITLDTLSQPQLTISSLNAQNWTFDYKEVKPAETSKEVTICVSYVNRDSSNSFYMPPYSVILQQKMKSRRLHTYMSIHIALKKMHRCIDVVFKNITHFKHLSGNKINSKWWTQIN